MDVHLGFINSWSKNIEDLFPKLDLSEKFINWEPVSINSVWALLHEDFCKNWEDNIKMMPKLRSYIKFKNVFKVEPYVLLFMSRQRRSYLAQLINGILPLQLKVGRWWNKAIEDRLCLICNNGTVEDEEHFLFHCIFHYGECQDVYNYMKNNIPNFNNLSIEQKLQTVMTEEYVQIFSKYLCKIYQMRQNKLFV